MSTNGQLLPGGQVATNGQTLATDKTPTNDKTLTNDKTTSDKTTSDKTATNGQAGYVHPQDRPAPPEMIPAERQRASDNTRKTTLAVRLQWLIHDSKFCALGTEFVRLTSLLRVLVTIAEDYWPLFVKVTDSDSIKIMRVCAHTPKAFSPDAVFVSTIANSAPNATPKELEWLKGLELGCIKDLIILIKNAKTDALAEAKRDGALAGYEDALKSMTEDSSHPGIQALKHILARYLKHEMDDLCTSIIRHCGNPAIRNYALGSSARLGPIDPPTVGAQSVKPETATFAQQQQSIKDKIEALKAKADKVAAARIAKEEADKAAKDEAVEADKDAAAKVAGQAEHSAEQGQ
ncbi:hypothetical protein Q8F55_006561 [Vanrija albida]|uniref:Uncharacterized protein n=1 Tax=Vanrija albida TaxID=181172 RepID=A0ABR3PXT2_9TREE